MTDQITDVENFFSTTLTAGVSDTSTTFNVESTGTLTSPCYIVIDGDTAGAGDDTREVILCDGSFTGTSFATLDRAANTILSGGAKNHSIGAVVEVRPVAQHIDDLNDRVGGHDHTGGDAGVAVATASLTGHNKAAHDALALDHGAATGLNDDDHTQYYNATRHTKAVHDALAIDHGVLTGVADDDHTQYSLVSGARAYTGAVKFADGTSALPGLSFSSDTDTGMYRYAANDLGFATAGSVRARIGSSGLLLYGNIYGQSGTLTVEADDAMVLDTGPGFDMIFRTGGANRGWYDDSIDAWRWFNGGTEMLRFDGNDLQMIGGGQIKAENGSAGAPGYTFDSDHNAGMFLQSGYLRFGLNGLQMLAMSPSQAVMYQYLDVQDNIKCDGIQVDQDGSRANPAIKFNDPDTGWYHNASLNRIICTVDLGGNSAYVGSTITVQTAFVPGRDNVMELGNNTFRWDEIWATDSAINTSDVRTKNSVEDSNLGLDFVRAIRPVTFVRNGRTRPHEGFVAQEVKAAMDGLGVEDFAGYIDPEFDPPDPEKWPEAYNEDGSFKADRMSKGLRYGEFIGPAYHAIQEIADRLEALENA